MVYQVTKIIGGRAYLYNQWTYREDGRVRTGNRYLGPVDGYVSTTTDGEEPGSDKRRKRGILGVIDELVRKNKAEPQETEEQVRERVAAEDREYAERDRINEALTADTISLDAISEIAASQAETVASDAVAESTDTTTGVGESGGEADGEADGGGEGDSGEGSA